MSKTNSSTSEVIVEKCQLRLFNIRFHNNLETSVSPGDVDVVDVHSMLVYPHLMVSSILTLLIHSTTKATICLPLTKLNDETSLCNEKPPCPTKPQRMHEEMRGTAFQVIWKGIKRCLCKKRSEATGEEISPIAKCGLR
ncbi:hypothetical protein Tco_0269748 [Tanacetum coccineum]